MPAAELPSVLDLLKAFFEEFKTNFAQYVIAGLGFVCVVLPLSFAMVFGIYASVFVGMLPGIALEDEALLALGPLAAVLVFTVAAVALTTAITVPLQASLARSVDDHLAGRAPLGPGAPFTRAMEDLPLVLLYSTIHTSITLVLLMFCYLPGIVFAFLTDFAWLHVVLDRKSPMDALKTSMEHVRDHASWHLGYFGVTIGIVFIVSYLPLIGYFIAPGALAGWRVWVFRRVISPTPA